MADDKTPPASEGIVPGNPPAPPMILYPSPRPQSPPLSTPARTPPKGPGPGDMKDGTREVIETVVFVVVLVLLLRTFLAEAFVIPTGSMATTLLGYHYEVTCDACGYRFLVNASPETEDKNPVMKCRCANCRYLNILRRQFLEGEKP